MAIGPDVVDVLVEDHRQIEGLLAELAGDGAAQTGHDDDRLLSVSVAELARHVVVEEEYLYPLISEILPDGAQLAAHGVSLSGEAEQLMQQLQGPASSGPDREPVVAQLLRVVRRHARETEAVLFPALRRACTPEQLGHLAGVVELAKKTAPTRAHPGLPHTTPWNQILAPGVGLADKARDALTRRPTKPDQI